MTVRLTVDRAAWMAHVQGTADAYGHGLVPVVKGNGYGFHRAVLHEVVRSSGATVVCVGTVHELHDVPPMLEPLVLTPTLSAPVDTSAMLTVGHLAHVHPLRGWHGRVLVKLASSMRRHGVEPADLPALMAAVRDAGPTIEGYAIHLPLDGTDTDRLAEIDAWLPHLDPSLTVWTSHLAPAAFHSLQATHGERRWKVRIGTALWHGSPRGSFLHLSADVLHTREVSAGDVAGYRHASVPFDGTLVVVGAGSAAGIAPLDDHDHDHDHGHDQSRRSPFHFAHRRLALLEPPHMHTSLVVVPRGQTCPKVGDQVDVQRPLTATAVDEVMWR